MNALFRNVETSASSNELDSIFIVLNLSAVIKTPTISSGLRMILKFVDFSGLSWIVDFITILTQADVVNSV